MALTYRVLTTIEEFHQAGALESSVWRADPLEIVPASLMRAIALNGGLAVGAFDDDALVGVSLAFTGLRGGKLILWSHMTGVHPDYQGRDIGFTLKQYQRTWALGRGFDEIRWTFDPLQRGNANFNLHRLGVVANLYHENFYGMLNDELNDHTPSDRLEVIWRLKDPRVAALASGQMQLPSLTVQRETLLLAPDENGRPEERLAVSRAGDLCFVEIPAHINALARIDRNAAAEWRLALRRTLQAAFARGYSAVDFVPTPQSGAYVLERQI
ncbi:MAG: GNAT family N-acetyltransferase [Candidatus Flexifilum sp.]|jgi:predicted GNAT superfamily acetyltransferase